MPSSIFRAPTQMQIDYFRQQTGVSSTSSLREMIIQRFTTLLGLIPKDGTRLLIHFDGSDAATTYTAESGQTVTFVNQAQLDNAQTKFGATSLLLDGAADYITVPDNADWAFGTGDFTIDMWIMFNAHTSHAGLYSQYTDANNYVIFYWDTVTGLNFLCKSSSTTLASYQAAWTPSNSTWYHLTLSRQQTNIYIYINGTAQSLTTTTAIAANTIPDLATAPRIGDYGDASTAMFNGWIDEVRIQKSISVTSNFTTRTTAYPWTDTIPASASDLVRIRLNNLGYTGPLGDMLNDFFRVKSGSTDRVLAETIFFSNVANNFA